jgi:hypothetical protein
MAEVFQMRQLINCEYLWRAETGDTAGKRLRAILGDERLEEAEIEAIATFRHQPDGAPPRFE